MSMQNRPTEVSKYDTAFLDPDEPGINRDERTARRTVILADAAALAGRLKLLVENPEEAARHTALKIVENLRDFEEGRASHFTAYFAGFDPLHRSQHIHFVDLLGLEPFHPVEDRTPGAPTVVRETEQSLLIRQSVVYADGTPGDVRYTAQRPGSPE